MISLELTYNPYKLETNLEVFGKEAPDQLVKSLCGYKGTELSSWANDFWERSVNQFNDDLSVIFNGIDEDYALLEKSLNAFRDKKMISLYQGRISTVKKSLIKANKIFEEMQNNVPSEELKKELQKSHISSNIFYEVEIGIVSFKPGDGKTSLIESFLYRNNYDNTSDLCNIDAMKDKYNIKTVAVDKDNSIHKIILDFSKSNLHEKIESEYLKNNNISYFEFCLPFCALMNNSINLVLTDMSNCINDYNLQSDYAPYLYYNKMIVFVLVDFLNFYGIETKTISDIIRHYNNDQVFFILTKVDCFDPEYDGTFPQIIDKFKKYLAKNGFKEPQIFPIAAKMAIALKKAILGLPMTVREEEDILPRYNGLIKYEENHFSEWASLSLGCKDQQNRMIEKAKKQNDKMGLALIYTGIPALELAITEYLNKFTLATWITNQIQLTNAKIGALITIAEKKEKDYCEIEKKLNEEINIIDDLLSCIDLFFVDIISFFRKVNISFNNIENEQNNKILWQCKIITAGMQNEVSNDIAGEYFKILTVILPDLFISLIDEMKNIMFCKFEKQIEGQNDIFEDKLLKLESGHVFPQYSIKDKIKNEIRLIYHEKLDEYYSSYKWKDLKKQINEEVISRIRLSDSSIINSRAVSGIIDNRNIKKYDFKKYLEQELFPLLERFDMIINEIARSLADNMYHSYKEELIKRFDSLKTEIMKDLNNERNSILTEIQNIKNKIENNRKNLNYFKTFMEKNEQIIQV